MMAARKMSTIKIILYTFLKLASMLIIIWKAIDIRPYSTFLDNLGLKEACYSRVSVGIWLLINGFPIEALLQHYLLRTQEAIFLRRDPYNMEQPAQ